MENKRDLTGGAVDGEIPVRGASAWPNRNGNLTPAKANEYWMGWLRRTSEEGLNRIH